MNNDKLNPFNDKNLAKQVKANKKYLMVSRKDRYIYISNAHWAVKIIPNNYPKTMKEICIIFKDTIMDGLPDKITMYDGQLRFDGHNIEDLFKKWKEEDSLDLLPTKFIKAYNLLRTNIYLCKDYPVFIDREYGLMVNEERVKFKTLGELNATVIYSNDEMVGGILPIKTDMSSEQSKVLLQLANF